MSMSKKIIIASILFTGFSCFGSVHTVSCPQKIKVTQKNLMSVDPSSGQVTSNILPKQLRREGFSAFLSFPLHAGTFQLFDRFNPITNAQTVTLQTSKDDQGYRVAMIRCVYHLNGVDNHGAPIFSELVVQNAEYFGSVGRVDLDQDVAIVFPYFNHWYEWENNKLYYCNAYRDNSLKKFNKNRCIITWSAPD